LKKNKIVGAVVCEIEGRSSYGFAEEAEKREYTRRRQY